MPIHYAPGPAFALVRPGVIVLVDAAVGTSVAADLWAAVDAARAPGACAAPGGWDLAPLLDAVTEVLDPTWRSLPSFAVVVLGPPGGGVVQVALRGEFSAVVTTRAGDGAPSDAHQEATEKVTGPDVTTWVDKTISDVVRVELVTGADADAAPLLSVVEGIVQAERVRWDVADHRDDADDADDEDGHAELDDAGLRSLMASASSARSVSGRASTSVLSPAPAAGPARELTGPLEAHSGDQGETDFGRTLAAAPEEWEEDVDDTTYFAAALAQIKGTMPGAGAVHPAPPAAHAAPAPLTSAVPPPPPPVSAVVHEPPVLPHTQHPTPVARFRDPAPQGTEVLARSCFFGHHNPPAHTVCARCGGGLSPAAHLVERPSLGRVEVSTGECLDLSVPVVVGRFPQAQTAGSPIAQRLVTVPSPSQDISRSHLEIRLDGWHVLIVDLDTVNGTTLLRPGHPLRRLHPLQPTPVGDGDVVDLGDGITLTFRELL